MNRRHRLLALGLLVLLGVVLTMHLRVPDLAVLRQALGAHPVLGPAVFFAAYVVITALSLPIATLLSLAAGALFGVAEGSVLVSFAASLGASLAFLASRFLLRDFALARFPGLFARVNAGIARDGAFYLVSLRLVPAIPFFALNLLAGLTNLSLGRFYLASQIGMLPATVIFVNAGAGLAGLAGHGPVLTPRLATGLVLLALLPVLAPRLRDALTAKHLYARWRKPKRFERDIVVIGGGAAGLVASYVASALKAKVTLIERAEMGGDCLNTGCVPSKALLYAARAGQDFTAARAAVRAAVAGIAPHDSRARYTALGVDVREGQAFIETPWQVRAGCERITTRAIIIAAGAAPVVPPIPGLADCAYATSETLWDIDALPARLVILGGGPIGCEMAQAFALLGSAVTLVEAAPRLLVREDEEVSALIMASLRAAGVEVRTGHRAIAARPGFLRVAGEQGEVDLPFDRLLLAIGRKPRVSGYGLEELGIPLTKPGTIETNDGLQTLYPNIFACGDVAGPYQFTHMAGYQAGFAAINALLAPFWRLRPRYHAVPAVTFTTPEIARVGLNEQEAKARNVAYEVTRYVFTELDRAITEADIAGFVKVLTRPGSDKILGATIVGTDAGEMLTGFTIAMQHGLGLKKLLGVIYPYPTRGEAIRAVAGQWRQAHAPGGALVWLERLHRWRRG
ncbi:FAD-dependent oxidoreductase [Acidocella sp. KAb 2-4]|uniref:FAD-dependent oxidoreductase n=1 Tax=Acidocella sp. KAb 2-4 TaxID=2885158 RepID=UPI001D087DF7|nr:FAD-dependent oxidoreductase [Acidocella sp. KAb 2-4]MCB5944674.1 FAD-dependent oxidoreductase [Acidocella sp. KAb 2-4]